MSTHIQMRRATHSVAISVGDPENRDLRPALWSGAADDRLGEPDLAGPGSIGLPGVAAAGCGHGAHCARGETNLCETYDELGFTRPGAAADQVIVPAKVVHALSDSASMLEAALAEPAGVGWRGGTP